MAKFPAPSRSKLPPPPSTNEASHNLLQPEHAPSGFVDGRSLRATGRTIQFTTRVREDLLRDIKIFAAQHGMRHNDLLEKAFAALRREMDKSYKTSG